MFWEATVLKELMTRLDRLELFLVSRQEYQDFGHRLRFDPVTGQSVDADAPGLAANPQDLDDAGCLKRVTLLTCRVQAHRKKIAVSAGTGRNKAAPKRRSG